MSSIPNEFPISLRSWPAADTSDATALPSLIQRINEERGGFQNITEESLRREIAEAEAAESAGDEDGSSEEDEVEDEGRMKELMAARDEILGQIEAAHTSASHALDFISLLLSKDTPIQAGLSMSEALKQLVPTGTLSADKLPVSLITSDQKEDNKRIAKGWKVQNLNKTVDTILEAASRLEKEIESETKYWEQVLAVSNKGWAICRLPNEKHTLGVRFGFSESSPAFKNQSLAALRRNQDGTISLDQGLSGTEPQTIRVRIHSDDVDTGSSNIPLPAPENAPVEVSILQARNTIFSAELWQELNREARILGTFDVRSKGDTLTFPLSSTKTVVLDVVPLGDSCPTPPRPDDQIAEGLSFALQLLLSFAHRQNHRRRIAPPPSISNQKRQTPPYQLIRPILARLKHQEAIINLHSILTPLCSILLSASISPPASYTITHSPPQPSQILNATKSESTILSLIDRLESITTFHITSTTTLTITSRTFYTPLPGTTFFLTLSPSSPLIITCPCPPILASLSAVEDYIYYCTSSSLASSFSEMSEKGEEGSIEISKDQTGREGWYMTAQPNMLRKIFEGGRGKQIIFDVKQMNKPHKSTGAENRNGHTKGKSGDSDSEKGVVKRDLATERRNNLRLRVGWEWMTRDFSLGKIGGGLGGGNGNGEEKKIGEGRHEWRVTRSKDQGGSDEEVEEIVRGIGEIVETAGRWDGGDGSGEGEE